MVHVVLVLAHANALGIDLHQLGQRVLQAAGNRGRAAQAHVHIGHFLRSVFTGGVHRGARLAHHHFVDLDLRRTGLVSHLGQKLDQVRSQLVGLAAGGAVADGNQVHAVFGAQLAQGVQRALPVFAGLVGEHGGGFHQFAGGIDHRYFYTGANAGVQAHHHAGAGGGGQQQVAQVVSKHLDGDLLGVFPQAGKQVALSGQAELDLPGPGHALADQIIAGAALMAPTQLERQAAFSQGHHRCRPLCYRIRSCLCKRCGRYSLI